MSGAVVIGKQVEKGTPTLEGVMYDTFMLENPQNSVGEGVRSKSTPQQKAKQQKYNRQHNKEPKRVTRFITDHDRVADIKLDKEEVTAYRYYPNLATAAKIA